MIRRLLLRWALRTLHVSVSPSNGTVTVLLNGQPVPRGVDSFLKWPGRPGLNKGGRL